MSQYPRTRPRSTTPPTDVDELAVQPIQMIERRTPWLRQITRGAMGVLFLAVAGVMVTVAAVVVLVLIGATNAVGGAK
jgi:hypothetical protein